MTRRASWLVAAALMAALLSIGGPIARAHACSCAMMGPAERLANADAAFVGVVVALATPGPVLPELVNHPVTYAFAIEEPLKGSLDSRVTVASIADNGANCGISFAIAQRWRVYAHAEDAGRLATNGCAGNELLAEAVPLPPAPADPASGPPLQLLLALGVVGVVASISAWAFTRRGRGASA